MGDQTDQDSGSLQVRWRTISALFLVLVVSLLIALLVVAEAGDSDTLGTVALIMAIVAFAAQLAISIAQLGFGNAQNQRSERLNSETSKVLAEVSSRVRRLDETQTQQFSEIRDRLLPKALGEDLVYSIDRAVDQVALEDPRLAQMLERELSDLRNTIESKTERVVREELVRCPECSFKNRVMLGSITGDTATQDCSDCGQRFHAHRDDDGSVFRNRKGMNGKRRTNDPEDILSVHRMSLPDYGDRARYISQFIDEWRFGRVKVGADVSKWMDARSTVRVPFFFALANFEYGAVGLGGGPLRPAEQTVEDFPDDFDEEVWSERAHASWIAQALYRLQGWRRTREDELQFFFGDDHGERELSILNMAREFNQIAIDGSNNGARSPSRSPDTGSV